MFGVDLHAGDKIYSSWFSVHIYKGIDELCHYFILEGDPSYLKDIEIGSPCMVYINKTLMITGFIEICEKILDPNKNIVRIAGRSKCADLIDCNPKFFELKNAKLDDILSKYLQDYEISFDAHSLGRKKFSYWSSNPLTSIWENLQGLSFKIGSFFVSDKAGDLSLLTTARKISFLAKEGENLMKAREITNNQALYSSYVGHSNIDMEINSTFSDHLVKRNRQLTVIDNSATIDELQNLLKFEIKTRRERHIKLSVSIRTWTHQNELIDFNNIIKVKIPSLDIDGAFLVRNITYKASLQNGFLAELGLSRGE